MNVRKLTSLCRTLILTGGLTAGEFGSPVSPVPVDGLTKGMGVFLRGDRLYAVGGGELAVYNVAEPLKPRLLGKLNGLGNVRQIVVRGNRAYIAAREHGLWIVDASNDAAPKVISRFDTVELATGLDVAGPVAFVGQRNYGVELVDVSDPAHPRHLSDRRTSEAQSLRYDSGKLYVGNWAECELTIFDVTDPRNPRECSNTPLSGYGDGVDVRGNLCFAATGHHARTGADRAGNGHGLDILDISDPSKPVPVGRLKFPKLYRLSNDFWSVRLSGDTAVVADTHNGVFLCDGKDPAHPRITGRILLPEVTFRGEVFPDAVSSIAVGDGVVYLTGVRTGLWAAAVPGLHPDAAVPKGPAIPPPVPKKDPEGFFGYHPGGRVRGVAVRGDIAYVAAGSAGLHIVRLSGHGIEPLAVHRVGHAYDVKLRDGLLYLAEGEDGFGIYRLDGETGLAEVGRARMPQPWNDLAQLIWVPEGSPLAVVSSRGGLLRFYDVSDPAKIRKLLEHNQIGILYGDFACGELIDKRWFVNNWHVGGLAWYDLSGERPVPGGKKERISSANDGLAVVNGKLLVFIRGKYALAGAAEKDKPEKWTLHSAGEPLSGIPTVDGPVVAVSWNSRKSVRLYDFSSPENARPLSDRRWTFDDYPGTVAFWRNKCVIPLGNQGLLLEK